MNFSALPPAPPTARWLPSRAAAAIAAAFAVLLLAGTTFLLSSEFSRSESMRREVRQSFSRRVDLQAMLSLHQDVEIGQRGYVITGDRAFLEPYSRAKSQIHSATAKLAQSLEGAPGFRSDMARIRALSAEKLRIDDESVSLRDQGRTAEAAALIAGGRGKQVMDSLRSTISRLDRSETRQLDRKISAARAAAWSAQRMSAAFEIVLILLLAVAASVVARSFEQRKRAHRRVEHLAARQSAIFGSAKDGIIVVNASGSIESLNPAAAAMFGYDETSLVRRDVGLLFELAPDRGRVETFLVRLQRRLRGAGVSQEFWARRRDGSSFPAEVTLSQVDIPDGPRFVAIVRDATERKQVERMKTEFVSTVSHELRTPLTSIAGSLGLLAGGAAGNLPGPAERLVTVARDNCQRLIRLINDILDVEKIESGKMQFEVGPVLIASVMEDAVAASEGLARQQGIRLVLGQIDREAMVMGDSDALAQVLTNLIGNAIKFSPHGKAVRIDLERRDRGYRISVSDRGAGIPQDFRPHIFGKFAQADSSDARSKGGTGLGLAIVREIVSRLGGTVGFEDREGGGTTFFVDLASTRSARAPIASPDTGGEDRPLILHVDDDPDLVRITAEAFGESARLRTAPSLAIARRMIARRRHDAILVDLALPDGSGLELIEEIKRRPDAPPIVIFSAEEVDRAAASEADAVLIKARASLDRLVATTLVMIFKRRRKAA